MQSRAMTTTGLVIRALVALVLAADGAVPLFVPHVIDAQMAETGFPMSVGWAISACALASAILYAIPRTAVLGAILTTGFFGGAICTHLRLGETTAPPQIISLVLGVLCWSGLYLTDARVRALIPLRR